MKRNLGEMAARFHDVVIVGGGITGACVARDATLRGLRVALVEKGDFCEATSAASSKLIHGGLRYLKNLEFSLVRESLRERRIWEIIAPHQVYPLPTLMPIYRRSGSPSPAKLRAGLTLYDLLAFDRNRLHDSDKKLPRHKMLSREQALATEPGLPPEDLLGAIVYYDCQMDSPERLCLEHLIDAEAHGAHVANYAEVTHFDVQERIVEGVHVRDVLTGARHLIRGRVFVNASGPWADRLLGALPSTSGSARLVRSKGIHIVTRPLTQGHAVVLEHAGAHFFLLPWRGHTLIGTTDTAFTGDPDDFAVTERDIDEFLAIINDGYPAAALDRSDVSYFYGGMRPLVESSNADTYTASRRSEVYDHHISDRIANLVSAVGGKWTTSRHLAEQVLAVVGRKLPGGLEGSVTHRTPLPGGHMQRYAEFLAAATHAHEALEPHTVAALVRAYGSRYEDVLRYADDVPHGLQPLSSTRPEIRAQVVHAVREEMALTLDDVVFRRTGLGTSGNPGLDALQETAAIMANELGWSDDEREAQVVRALARYRPAPTRAASARERSP